MHIDYYIIIRKSGSLWNDVRKKQKEIFVSAFRGLFLAALSDFPAERGFFFKNISFYNYAQFLPSDSNTIDQSLGISIIRLHSNGFRINTYDLVIATSLNHRIEPLRRMDRIVLRRTMGYHIQWRCGAFISFQRFFGWGTMCVCVLMSLKHELYTSLLNCIIEHPALYQVIVLLLYRIKRMVKQHYLMRSLTLIKLLL